MVRLNMSLMAVWILELRDYVGAVSRFPDVVAFV